jgi:hypothetical protein
MYECRLHKETVVMYCMILVVHLLIIIKNKKIQGFKLDKIAEIPKSQNMLLDSPVVLQHCMF